jgi:hypothetical protein
MPSERDWLPETRQGITDPWAWRNAVISALETEDLTSLGDLFHLRVQEIGTERATQAWLEIVSSWDSSAVTG